MRSIFLLAMLSVLAVITGTACSANGNKVTPIAQRNTSTAPTTYADGANRITIPELQDKIKKDEVFIVDVRDEASYNAGHLPGAKLIPASQILQRIDELPKNKLIVTYCS